MLASRVIMWVVLAVVTAMAVAWHWHENRLMERSLREAEVDDFSRARLMHFAWERSSRFLLVLLGLLGILMFYEWQARHVAGEQAAAVPPSLPAPVIAVPAAAPPLAAAAPAEPPQAAAPAAQEPPPSPAAQEAPSAAATAAPPLRTIPGIVGEVYAPDQHSQELPVQLDQLKQRYEAMFVTHFFLLRCKAARAEDFHVINSSLMQELASYNAQSRLQYDILTAARGSYDEIYARTPCTPANVTSLKSDYTKYIQALAGQSNMPPAGR